KVTFVVRRDGSVGGSADQPCARATGAVAQGTVTVGRRHLPARLRGTLEELLQGALNVGQVTAGEVAMFNLDKYPWIVPVLLVFVGVGWLLNTLDIVPGVNWAYTLGVGAVGLVLLLQGLNRFSFVVGTFLIVGAFCSYLRQTGYLK